MPSDLEALVALVTPPDDVPAADPPADVALPSDHLALLARYGPGEFLPGLALYVPGGAPGGGFDLAAITATYAEVHASWAAAGEPALAPDGLLPWADDEDHSALHFVTTGPPERWTVVLVDYEGYTLIPLEGTSTSVLLALHDGTLHLPTLAEGELSAHCSFAPAE